MFRYIELGPLLNVELVNTKKKLNLNSNFVTLNINNITDIRNQRCETIEW